MHKQQSHLIMFNLLTKYTHTINQSILCLHVGKMQVLSADLTKKNDWENLMSFGSVFKSAGVV